MRHCSERHVALLQELRYVTAEVGSLSEARAMPREVRQWWISQMQKEREAEAAEYEKIRNKR